MMSDDDDDDVNVLVRRTNSTEEPVCSGRGQCICDVCHCNKVGLGARSDNMRGFRLEFEYEFDCKYDFLEGFRFD